MCIQEAGKLVSGLLALRTPKLKPPKGYQPPAEPVPAPKYIGEEKVEEGTACLPCVNGHFSVCSGLISDEAIRMARRHGIGDEEISRINKCLDQLNAMEREDLSIDKISELPQWEKDLALYAQSESAEIRHGLEHLESVDDLEHVALKIKKARMTVGQTYFKNKLAHMPKEEKTKLAELAMQKMEEQNE